MNRIGTSSSEDNSSIAIDNEGNIIVAGKFLNTIDLDASELSFNVTSHGSYDIFITRYDNASNYLW